MKKVKLWSISTTTRNPDRLRGFLEVLDLMRGSEWTKENQERFQILLIQNKKYGYGENQFYTDLTDEQKIKLDYHELTYEDALNILNEKDYVGGGDMRGRQSFNALNKMGFAYIDANKKIYITSLGDYFLHNYYDLGEVLFKSLLKWQYFNSDSNIIPFIASLHIIDKVNKLCKDKQVKAKGISRVEFALFLIPLMNYQKINETVENLLYFREKINSIESSEEKNIFIKNYFFQQYSYTEKDFKNIFEYADNIIRYFRITRYFFIRGNGWYIDLEPRRAVEIKALIKNFSAKAIEFDTDLEFYKYLGNINQPLLPWDNIKNLKESFELLKTEINQKLSTLKNKNILISEEYQDFQIDDSIESIKTSLNKLRDYRDFLTDIEKRHVSQSISQISTYIQDLKKIFSNSNSSIELEKLVSLSLHSINDALKIKPNYPVGDDSEPTFTAPANMPDIECYYETFNSICEVTMLTNRSQWYNEGQPVMRHLRDFELKNNHTTNYCLFISPRIHRDTLNTFWIALKYEYEGKPQKIIPLSISQFTDILNGLIFIKQQNKSLTHKQLKNLYDSITDSVKELNNSEEWIKQIPAQIENWLNKIKGEK